MTSKEKARQHLIENWVDELLHHYSEHFQDRSLYFSADYLLMEAILDSALSHSFYKGQPPLETFLKNIKGCFPNKELPEVTQELTDKFNKNFKNEPNFQELPI